MVGETKECTQCGSEYPTTSEHFAEVKKGSGRLRSTCRACGREKARQNYHDNKESYRKRSREWAQQHPERMRELQREWYCENREAHLKRTKQYQSENREKLSQAAAEYRSRNAAKIRERSQRWRAENKDKVRVYNHSRRRSGSTIVESDIIHKIELQIGLCFYCCKRLNDNYHVDHLIPIALGGSNSPENIVIACPTCNLQKNSIDPTEFLVRKLRSGSPLLGTPRKEEVWDRV